MLLRFTRFGLGTGGLCTGYLHKILSVERANLIGLWLQNEAGGAVSYDRSRNAHHGAYTGVTLGEPGVPGMGYTCPLFDGSLDYNNIHSAELAAAFNGAEGTIIVPVKVYNAAVWEDDATRFAVMLSTEAGNYVRIWKDGSNNKLYFRYKAGGVQEQVGGLTVTPTTWAWVGITWSKTAGEDGQMIAYYLGEQVGSTQTALGTWAGSLLSTQTVVGASATTPLAVWHGWLGPVSLWTKALTPAQIAYVSAP